MEYVHLDTEFIRNNLTPTGLISIGIATEDAKYYAVNAGMNVRQACELQWMVDNVWKHIPNLGKARLDRDHPDVKDYGTIRTEIDSFFSELNLEPNIKVSDQLSIIVDHGSQDMVRLHTLWNNDWEKKPWYIPTMPDEIERIKKSAGVVEGRLPNGCLLPTLSPDQEHHALNDATHMMNVHQSIRAYLKMERIVN